MKFDALGTLKVELKRGRVVKNHMSTDFRLFFKNLEKVSKLSSFLEPKCFPKWSKNETKNHMEFGTIFGQILEQF